MRLAPLLRSRMIIALVTAGICLLIFAGYAFFTGTGISFETSETHHSGAWSSRMITAVISPSSSAVISGLLSLLAFTFAIFLRIQRDIPPPLPPK